MVPRLDVSVKRPNILVFISTLSFLFLFFHFFQILKSVPYLRVCVDFSNSKFNITKEKNIELKL